LNHKDSEISLAVEDLQKPEQFQVNSVLTIDLATEKDKDQLQKIKSILSVNPGSTKLKIMYGEYGKKYIYRYINPKKEVLTFLKKYLIK
jgi:hypothetical protein